MSTSESETQFTIAGAVASIAGLLRGGNVLSSGDVAALRRMDPREPAAAFFKIVGLVLHTALPGDAAALLESETRWAAIVVGLAHLGSLHSKGADQRLGRVLADAGYSEQRLARLLEGDAQRLVDELPSLARYLAAKNLTVDWTGATRLMLSAGHDGEDQTRRHIARDYYGTLARQEGH